VRETAHQATGAPARTPIPAVASLTVNPERLERMWALSRSERLAAAQRGQFTLGEMLRWAARAPAGDTRSRPTRPTSVLSRGIALRRADGGVRPVSDPRS